jgi:hypothetical protein
MATKPVLSIGLDSKGKVVEIRVKGKKQKVKKSPKHKCPPGTKTVVLKLKFCKPSEREKDTGGSSGPGPGPTPPCCMDVGGRLICWPPCV